MAVVFVSTDKAVGRARRHVQCPVPRLVDRPGVVDHCGSVRVFSVSRTGCVCVSVPCL